MVCFVDECLIAVKPQPVVPTFIGDGFLAFFMGDGFFTFFMGEGFLAFLACTHSVC